MSYQIHTPCLPETSFCDGSAGCGNDTEMVAIARIMPIFTGKPWDEETAYGALEVVEEPDGTMYITKVPTPAGTPLAECKFWAVYNKNMWTHLEQEIAERQAADAALGERIDSEEAQRIAADATLQAAIEKEETARVADVAKLTQELAAEVADRAEADEELGERLDDEVAARKNADTELEQTLTAELDSVKGELDEKISAIPVVNNIAPVNVIDAPTVEDDYDSFAAGAKASADDYSTSVGCQAKGVGYSNVAIGRGAYAESNKESPSETKGAVSIGNKPNALSDGSVAIGADAYVVPSATNGVAIGNGARVHTSEGTDPNGDPKDGMNSVAIGYGSSVSSRNHFNVGNSSQQRIIGWVADPVDPTDAATKNYVDSMLGTKFIKFKLPEHDELPSRVSTEEIAEFFEKMTSQAVKSVFVSYGGLQISAANVMLNDTNSFTVTAPWTDASDTPHKISRLQIVVDSSNDITETTLYRYFIASDGIVNVESEIILAQFNLIYGV